ncbi:AAA domain-containing protein [Aquimarina muelleri]|uniref:AAA domain-containing protein n=1 Tax=Aquimarina muelleri TaxID=279356 RepID=UPI003F68902B
MANILNWLKYYRASLIDGSRGEKNNIFPNPLQRDSSKLNSIIENEIAAIWDDQKIVKFNFKPFTVNTLLDDEVNEHESIGDIDIEVLEDTIIEDDGLTEINKIEIAPVSISTVIEHGYKTGDTKLHYPFWIPAYVSKTGKLYPPKEGETPLFIRNHLEPNPRDLPTIAQMEVLDEKLKNRDFNTTNWSSYWKDCEHFFKEVTGKHFKDYQEAEYYQFSICKSEESNTTRNIINLYNDLVFDKNAEKQKHPILEKVLEVSEESKNYDLSKVEIFLNSNHFGQMNGEFPLSLSQRVAFAQFTSKYNKKAFAINGPPGTGKTTILQSVIANAISLAVLKKENAPLMVGCSTNNQAITNILDSMELKDTSDSLFSRWLPNVNSFGLYLAASSKGVEASKKYQIATTNFLNDGFVRQLDDKAKITDYEDFFKLKFQAHFQVKVTDEDFDVLDYLFKIIKNTKAKINKTSKIALRKFEITEILKNNGYQNYKELISKIETTKLAIHKNQEKYKELKGIQHRLSERNKSIPFYVKLLPIKKFREIRESAYKLIVQPFFQEFPDDFKWYRYSLINSEIEKLLFKTINEEEKLNQLFSKLSELKKDVDFRNEEYQKLKTNWLKNHKEKWEKLLKKTGKEYDNLEVLEDTAAKLDISYRNELFWCCVHYREWEYIQELKQTEAENKERGRSPYVAKLKRLAKVTPLFISTFHTLPKFSTYYKYPEGNRFYKELFDLMIVDEAGQVSPEVAAPSLTFTKKVLAVGDVYQIEPVWGVVKGVDYVNAEKYAIIKNEEDFETVDNLGFTASNGNLMKMIKKPTPFSFKHSNGESEKGAYLLEHRRCLNPIIEYSKDNVYKGSLKLMVGNKHNKKHDLPPLGYIHIDGSSEKHNGSSRKNIKEASAVIQWVINNKEKLETAYDKPLNEILAIITPFSAQKTILKQLLNKHLEKGITENLVIGTVHALQGAERPIILFSTVHDTKDKMLFFNYQGKFNMLNVALTRAKHSFIVIGNMAVLNPNDSSPSGRLGATLFSKEAYALSDTFVYQSEIVYQPNTINRIDTLEQHRKSLEKCFRIAQEELIIFSPFISIKAIENDNIIALINEAIKRGIKITILTDKHLDKVRNKLKENSELGRKAITATKASLIVVNGIHNKTICVDDKVIIEGSFNWLSATRDINSPYHRSETSVIIQGTRVKEDIERIKTVYVKNR